jgi:hypothetical protein
MLALLLSRLESMVFPRDQHNPDYDPIMLEHVIICYRFHEGAR